jgi:hypothetical protein
MKPFEDEKLRELYGSHREYVEQIVVRADELVDEGWLLSADAEAIKAEAMATPIL